MAKTWATKCCSGTYKNNYQLCCGIKDKDISKRYLSERFSDLFNEGEEDKAFNIFSQITPNDCQAMHNEKGNLVEEKVIEQFKLIENRIAQQ